MLPFQGVRKYHEVAHKTNIPLRYYRFFRNYFNRIFPNKTTAVTIRTKIAGNNHRPIIGQEFEAIFQRQYVLGN
jgi:hypothetical protein